MTNANTNIAAGIVTLKGKGKQARELAYVKLAPLAFVDSQSRGELIATLRNALGSNPSEAETEAAKQQIRIGRIASRLPLNVKPDGLDVPALLDWVAIQMRDYAAHDAKKIKPGQLGRRSEAFDKAMAASREYLSQIMAEVGTGNAKTQKEKNDQKATRSTNANPERGADKGKDKAKPSHAELVKPAAPTNANDYIQHMQTQMSALTGYDQKYAKTRPIEYARFAELLMQLRTAGNEAANAYQMRKAVEATKADGDAPAKAHAPRRAKK